MRYSKWSWPALAFFVTLLLGVFILATVLTNNAKSAAKERQAMLQEQLVNVTEERSALLREIDTIGTDSYIEDAARNEYGYVNPGEISFEIKNPEQLDNYTAREWQIILDEMAWDGK